MAMLGIPLEERKKAYAGKTMQDLVQDYQKAERSRDLPTMIALLDIIRTAPKPKAGPQTTVVQDTMAALMPQPVQTAMATPGIEGAVDAMAAQNAPQQLDMPAVMAADGGLMDSGEKPARFFLGGQGTVAPYSSFAALPLADVERMALMGDQDAQKELSNRMRSGIRPTTAPGPGIGPTTSQVTDQFRVGTPSAMPTTTTPAGASSTMGPPRPSGTSLGINRFLNLPGVRFLARHPYATALTTATTLGQPLVDSLMATDRGTPSAELDPISAMQGTQGGIDRTVPGQATFVNPPAASNAPTPPAPPAPGPGPGAPGAGLAMPAFPLNLADYKDKSIEDYIRERNEYEKKLGTEKGVRSIKDIKEDLEKFRTEATQRAAADKAAAKEAFQQDALLAAGLAAPQLLKGRGLAQAVARYAETATPGLMGAAQAQKAAIKEATKSEREAADKFKLAQLDLDKSYRAEELGKFDKAATLRSDSIKTYIQGSIEKYKADMSYAATMGYVDRIVAKGMIDAATERIKGLQLDPEFRKLDPQAQQRIINSILQGAVGQGGSQRPKIVDVPGQ